MFPPPWYFLLSRKKPGRTENGSFNKRERCPKVGYPGRHVEIHRKPITAAEILSKYPRHCIARPDVFKFPYIVVRPQLLLFPGKVFYLVPKRTLYNLLKARGQQSQPSLQENQCPHNHDHHGYSSRHTPSKCRGGMTPIHQEHDRGYRRPTKITDKIRIAPHRSYQPSPAASSIDNNKPVCSKGSHYHGHNVTSTLSTVRRRHNASSTLPTVMNGGMQTRSLGDHAKMKSCFRKQDSERKFLNLKVTFASSIIIPGRRPIRWSSPKQTVGLKTVQLKTLKFNFVSLLPIVEDANSANKTLL